MTWLLVIQLSFIGLVSASPSYHEYRLTRTRQEAEPYYTGGFSSSDYGGYRNLGEYSRGNYPHLQHWNSRYAARSRYNGHNVEALEETDKPERIIVDDAMHTGMNYEVSSRLADIPAMEMESDMRRLRSSRGFVGRRVPHPRSEMSGMNRMREQKRPKLIINDEDGKQLRVEIESSSPAVPQREYIATTKENLAGSSGLRTPFICQ